MKIFFREHDAKTIVDNGLQTSDCRTLNTSRRGQSLLLRLALLLCLVVGGVNGAII